MAADESCRQRRAGNNRFRVGCCGQQRHALLDGERGVDDANAYLQALALRGLSDLTLRAYAYDLLLLYRWLADTGLALRDLTAADLLAFIAVQRQAGAAPQLFSIIEAAIRTNSAAVVLALARVIRPTDNRGDWTSLALLTEALGLLLAGDQAGAARAVAAARATDNSIVDAFLPRFATFFESQPEHDLPDSSEAELRSLEEEIDT